MCVNFLKLTVSTFKKQKYNGIFNIPLFQFMSSFASDPQIEFEKYEEVKRIVENHNKIAASNLLTGNKICFATNYFYNATDRKIVTNLDVSLLLVLVLENRHRNSIITVDQINDKYKFDRPEYTRQIKKFKELRFAVYKFSEREFYDNLPVFDKLKQTDNIIEFVFSRDFQDYFLASGKILRVPVSALTYKRDERNALYTLGQIYISLIAKVQNYFQNSKAGKMSVEFSLRDLFEFCGLNLKLIKFHKLAEFTYDMIHDFAKINSMEEDEDFSVNSIIIKKYNSSFEFPDNAESFKSLFARKKELIDSIIEITFDQRDPFF